MEFKAFFVVFVLFSLFIGTVSADTYQSGKIYPTTDGTLKEGGNGVNQTFEQLLVGTGDRDEIERMIADYDVEIAGDGDV